MKCTVVSIHAWSVARGSAECCDGRGGVVVTKAKACPPKTKHQTHGEGQRLAVADQGTNAGVGVVGLDGHRGEDLGGFERSADVGVGVGDVAEKGAGQGSGQRVGAPNAHKLEDGLTVALDEVMACGAAEARHHRVDGVVDATGSEGVGVRRDGSPYYSKPGRTPICRAGRGR